MKFYELTGKKRKAVLAIFDEYQTKAKQIKKDFRKRFGGNGFYSTRAFGAVHITGLSMPEGKEPDSKLWRKYYNIKTRSHEDWYVPNRSTKQGRELATELRKMSLPGGESFAKAAGGNIWDKSSGLRYSTPGVDVWGPRQRVFVTFDDSVKQPSGEGVKRISDVEFERLQAKYNKKPARKK